MKGRMSDRERSQSGVSRGKQRVSYVQLFKRWGNEAHIV